MKVECRQMWRRTSSYLLAEHWKDLYHYFLTASIPISLLCMCRHSIRPLPTVSILLGKSDCSPVVVVDLLYRSDVLHGKG